MIRLTRLNQEMFYINTELIEFIDATPDTVISMLSGRKIVVSESCEQVCNLVLAYRREMHNAAPMPYPG